MMQKMSAMVDATYGTASLADKLLANLEQAGMDTSALTTKDLITFDELHIMGREATVDLGRRASLSDTMHVLDIGSGVGGPARTLAENFGCRVTGLDLAQTFVDASQVLSDRVGLGGLVSFRQGDALAMPFEDNTFDAAFMIHLNMNITDKKAMFLEARRVLKKQGVLVLWEVCKGDNDAFVFPVPWADDASFSSLASMDELVDVVKACDFSGLLYEDATEEAAQWVRARLAAGKKKDRPARPMPDLDLVLKDFRLKRANISKNLLQGSIRLLRAFATVKP